MPRVINVPTLHVDQDKAWSAIGPRSGVRYGLLRCGRRWGKNEYGYTDASEVMLNKGLVGWFAPDYKRLEPVFPRMSKIMEPVKKYSNASDRVLEIKGGGRLECWTLSDPTAGRGREYDLVILDEAAFAKSSLGMSVLDIFQQAIEPTLLIRRGRALVMSNSAGKNPENFMYRLSTEAEHGFTEYYAPSWNSPYVPPDEIERLRASRPPLVFAQEYGAEYVDWSGVAFFAEASLLDILGQPYQEERYDGIFAIVDTAAKTKKENDGTGVVWFGLKREGLPGPRLVILDWEYKQIQGDMLATWMPEVLNKCEAYARHYRARGGVLGVWIEDKASGIVLIQQMQKLSTFFKAIDSGLTSMGKSERALNASPYVYQRLVGIDKRAYDKTCVYKERSANHLINQITSFRVGDTEDRDDDLLDCMTYGCMIGVGGYMGY